MLVKRRLCVLQDLIKELNLNISVTSVPSAINKADELTRVSKAWLRVPENDLVDNGIACAGACDGLTDMHKEHHMGVDRTLFLARQVNPSITRKQVRRVVRGCERCQSIDPAPIKHVPGLLSLRTTWTRLAVDVTHYHHRLYLSLVDCGPGRFAVWRELRTEAAPNVCKILDEVFKERGPPSELLMDNSSVFHSADINELMKAWCVTPFYRAAYRPSGNGIVERHHRTIKSMAERARVSPTTAVFWYNMSPKNGQDESSIPHRSVNTYNWRHPRVYPALAEQTGEIKVEIGQEVWVKPSSAKCTSQWSRGMITDVNSPNNVSVDGVPRHVLDVRPVINSSESSSESETEDDFKQNELVESTSVDVRRSGRERRPPVWLDDYATD